MDWGNTIISARWNFIFNNKLFSNTTVAFNKYRFYADTYTYSQHTDITTHQATTNKYSADYRSGIQDWSYKMDFDYHPTPAHRIKFGAEYLYHSFRPEVMTSKISERTDNKLPNDTIYHGINNRSVYAHEASAYIEDNFRINPRLRVNLGLNFSLFHVQQKSYFSVQPRVSARYQLTKDFSLKASYTKMNQ